ncbi:transferase hexapeptide repeat containing protein [Chlorogloeopsis sp. ULAP01]|uniref:transferase hexapeptide repeat containing protein n=1 Tax=Chlorogloeopsis sp. ULAP01 TaxID=3056483 RepID=UPI0025AB166B|nr:transferase hexapeptide repeat containing protein [Chlorogloeopsis sp. ULAP01]MDM9380684.1 transferase hexapeptide repeat containing protein [Chlorogloeopsis sp. ULAP01]
MLDEVTLERRLAILEQEVADLKRKSDRNSTSSNWLDKIIGSISDQAAFLEALEYGRSFRQADKPIDESDEQA